MAVQGFLLGKAVWLGQPQGRVSIRCFGVGDCSFLFKEMHVLEESDLSPWRCWSIFEFYGSNCSGSTFLTVIPITCHASKHKRVSRYLRVTIIAQSSFAFLATKTSRNMTTRTQKYSVCIVFRFRRHIRCCIFISNKFPLQTIQKMFMRHNITVIIRHSVMSRVPVLIRVRVIQLRYEFKQE